MADSVLYDEDNSWMGNSEEDDENAIVADDNIIEPIKWETLTYSTSGSVVNTDIESVMNKLGDGSCIVPGFQRKFVWKKEQVAGLALSILKGIPVPPIYVYYDEEGREVILDGQQRLTAVFLYFHNLFFSSDNRRNTIDYIDVHKKMRKIYELKSSSQDKNESTICIDKIYSYLKDKYELVETKYEVKGDESQKRNITFSDLSEKDRRLLKRKALQFAVVQCSNGENSQRFYTMVFKMLNTGGKNLCPQEIRNGLYWKSTLYKELFELNKSNDNWRHLYGNVSLYSKDVELLLKMLSLDYYTKLLDDSSITIEYEGTFNWSNIMMSYSECLNTWDDEDVLKKIQSINSFLNSLEFDEDVKKCKKAVLEAVYVTCSKLDLIFDNDHKIKMSWLVELSQNDDIFGDGKVLSNKKSVETRLTNTLPLVKKDYGNYKYNI